MPDVHSILIRPVKNPDGSTFYGERGLLWDAWLVGEPLVRLCHHRFDPEHDACRKLVALGYAGSARTVDDRGTVRMHIADITRAARYSVVEKAGSQKRPGQAGLYVQPWKPFPVTSVRSPESETGEDGTPLPEG